MAMLYFLSKILNIWGVTGLVLIEKRVYKVRYNRWCLGPRPFALI